jgi:hypothetical protein
MRTKHALKFKAKAKERLPYLEGLEGNSESCVNGKTAALNIIFFVYLIKIEWQQIWKQKRRLTLVNRRQLKDGNVKVAALTVNDIRT